MTYPVHPTPTPEIRSNTESEIRSKIRSKTGWDNCSDIESWIGLEISALEDMHGMVVLLQMWPLINVVRYRGLAVTTFDLDALESARQSFVGTNNK